MSELQKITWDRGNDLCSVGFALEAIADLLGADGSEHGITDSLQNGLHHAVRAMGAFASAIGGELCEASDPEPQLSVAPQFANDENVARTHVGARS
ncbi:hypothetical protein [Pseudomonas sp. AL03]|uniref:hypothetical protein n=1 Tax=Pseudomonas sp. AL03 TaxID=3042230 RepID=UPI00249B44B1|nr:hypothetical protein [Pseudomonas sp. AL03]MDI3274854.1 hypothetical protein [Pseudomonas sp. AL03]